METFLFYEMEGNQSWWSFQDCISDEWIIIDYRELYKSDKYEAAEKEI